ncbi:uncharacterized protein TRIADDRAFT_21224 [Trichoplax adhaerens]|uniref:Ras-GAP domain-containing protein n=1 Tax=Trichoplax adhaerens TaxID=10228 RepID=B3RNI6_TRIAD|nr:hypothetical protein TRIADDRAFT_21224 [Trichoplax adhaerens]EDV28028.1 hypothetical protein TRIADDRAFT_21224 [Trichoplax adhaerens]|eukprot:XP_002109862.1 hypothetical protein TRIADDRAFT_21224 [Trichoplax adhaerens]
MAAIRLQKLQEKLKSEHSFITSEKDNIHQLNQLIRQKADQLCQQSWITKEHWLNIERILSVGSELTPSQCYHLANLLDASQFIDGYKSLGVNETKYSEFLYQLRQNPRLCARILAGCDRLGYDTLHLATLLFHVVFADCVYFEDEKIALQTLKFLIDYQILPNDHLEVYFQGGDYAFTILFKQFVAGVNASKIYLKAALQESTRQLLIEDDTYIEYEPDKVLYRMSEQEKLKLFGEPGTPKAETSMSNYLDNCRKRLVLICKTFLHNLKQRMYCFPGNIKWLMSHLYNSLKSLRCLEPNQIKSMLIDFLLNFYVCPAIVNPERYGIVGDASISDIARFNMSQVAKVMRFLSFADCGKKPPLHDNIYNYFELVCTTMET